MNEEQFMKAMEAAMNRATDRLVERRFAYLHVDDTNTGKGTLCFTDDGLALSRLLKKYFDVPNVSPQELRGEDIVSMVQVVLNSEPVQHPS